MKLSPEQTAKLRLTAAMLTFGTIGLFVRHISLPSSVIALVRGMVGTLFLLILCRVRGTPIRWNTVKDHLRPLLLSGALIGFNWILLFEAYRYTTVATATLCYYLAPVFVILASPFVLKEALTPRKIVCILAALTGMFFISGVLESGVSRSDELLGILCGTGAAVLYACVVLMNKKLTGVSASDRTIVQLAAAAAALLPYVLLTEHGTALTWTPLSAVLLLVLGVVHTGTGYTLYFSSIHALSAQTAALFSYIDPVSAIFFSALFLGEGLTVSSAVGAVLVLGSTLLCELPLSRRTRPRL